MNEQLQIHVRNEIKKGLSQCTEYQISIFKRMYSHDDLEKDIDSVVDDMPEDRLDWAMQQVQRTVVKNNE